MKRVCAKCNYSALCASKDFETIFYACAFQFAGEWMNTGKLTRDTRRLQRSAWLVVQAVQEVLPSECPELQPGTLRTVLLGAPGQLHGPAIDIVVGEPREVS